MYKARNLNFSNRTELLILSLNCNRPNVEEKRTSNNQNIVLRRFTIDLNNNFGHTTTFLVVHVSHFLFRVKCTEGFEKGFRSSCTL